MWSTTSDSTYLLAHLTEPPLLASKLKGITKCPALVFIRHLSLHLHRRLRLLLLLHRAPNLQTIGLQQEEQLS